MRFAGFRKLALTVSVCAAVFPSGAHAARFVLDVTGFASGFDLNGIFGLGGNLNEVAFSQRFTIDDGVAGARTFSDATSTTLSSSYGPSVVSNVFTVNGNSITFGADGSQDAGVAKSVSGGVGNYYIGVFDAVGRVSIIGNTLSFGSQDTGFLSSVDYRTPFSTTIVGGSGTVRYGFVDNLPDYRGNTVDLDLRPVTATLAAAVPEPGSWALIIGGLGVVGGVLRCRRTVSRSTVYA